MTVPNILSLARIMLVPPFVIALIYDDILAALILFVLAGFTDFLDGFIARRFGQKSLLGAYLDPMGDKLLSAAAFLSLGIKGLLPAWLVVIVIAKDVYLAVGAVLLYLCGQSCEPQASAWGKLCTFLQIATVAVALFTALTGHPPTLLAPLCFVTAVATAVAGAHYLWRGLRSLARLEGQ